MSPMSRKIRFAQKIAGAEDCKMFQRTVTANVIGLATATNDAIDAFAGITFLEQNSAFSESIDGRVIEKIFERALGQQSEEREIF